MIANSFLKSLATDLVLDTSQALELGFRDLSASDRVRYAVIGTKNSELAASNLLTLAQAERVAPQAARLGAGPLAGQMMVWAERPRQLALAIGPTTRALILAIDKGKRVIQQFRAVEGRQRSDLRWVYRHHPALDPSFVQRLDLEGEIRRDGIRLSGAAQGDLPPTPRFRSKDEVLLAIAGPLDGARRRSGCERRQTAGGVSAVCSLRFRRSYRSVRHAQRHRLQGPTFV